QRMAYQIAEHNYEAETIYLAGINNNGMKVARLIEKQLKKLVELPVRCIPIGLKPANPWAHPVTIVLPANETDLRNKSIIIVDDVANTGRTIFYTFKPLLDLAPHKVEVAVLVDRKHKLFPIKVDYVGLTLATTLKDNIKVMIDSSEEMEAFLE